MSATLGNYEDLENTDHINHAVYYQTTTRERNRRCHHLPAHSAQGIYLEESPLSLALSLVSSQNWHKI